MRVLLAGGSGFIGTALTRALVARGHRVTVLSRSGQGNEPQVSYLRGNVATAEGLQQACANQDAVVYLVGFIREKGGQTFQLAHLEGVRHTIAAMQSLGVGRLVHMSALGATLGSGSRYFETKALAEQAVLASGLEAVVLRPSLVFGPGDDFFGGVLKGLVTAPAPFIPMIGDGHFPAHLGRRRSPGFCTGSGSPSGRSHPLQPGRTHRVHLSPVAAGCAAGPGFTQTFTPPAHCPDGPVGSPAQPAAF